ncbi:sugar ABC transporter permease [Paenibacillus sp. Soil766]|uniref:carbohydrate ABC transporter permease n=1 Tax=Paenibacillus sp. Soil766 TaxID=1736404 RepID=UPI00070BC255|nr:sugar ABC transporter permease [Paenibacillus sp. Soil766]KRE98512.1 sugar ABC transporter permease [Paenibacillus sp. Soil766]
MQNKYTGKAVGLSLLFMGFGQWYNKQLFKGFLLFIFGLAGVAFMVSQGFQRIVGLITLGDTPRSIVLSGDVYTPVAGDHSVFLMVEGLISLLGVMFILLVYVLNVRDAYKVAGLRERGAQPHSFAQTLRHIRYRHFPYLILAIPAIFVVFLNVMPLIFSILIAFTNYAAPVLPPANLLDWVGFRIFQNLLTLKTWSRTFYGVLTWTVIWAVLATATTYVAGTLVAVLVAQKDVRLKKMWRTLLIVPFAIPNLVSLLVFRNLLNSEFGPINQYLKWFGLQGLPWLTDPLWAKFTVLMVNLWLGMPLIMVLVSGILTTIPRDLYESAEVDGARAWDKFRQITLPMVMFSAAPVLIMQFASNINNFNVIFMLTDGNPLISNYQYAGATDLLVTWLYKLTLTNNQYNFASVIGLIIFILIAGISIYNYRKTQSYKEDDIIQ